LISHTFELKAGQMHVQSTSIDGNYKQCNESASSGLMEVFTRFDRWLRGRLHATCPATMQLMPIPCLTKACEDNVKVFSGGTPWIQA